MTVAVNRKASQPTIHDPFRLLDHILARKYMTEMVAKRQQQLARLPLILKPRMDLCDDPDSDRVVATLELPGMRKEDITIDVKEGRIFVLGDRKPAAVSPRRSAIKLEQLLEPRARTAPPSVPARDADLPAPALVPTSQCTNYPIQEVKYGKFRRVIPLPSGTPLHRIVASLENGMLQISWPRPCTIPEVLRVEVK